MTSVMELFRLFLINQAGLHVASFLSVRVELVIFNVAQTIWGHLNIELLIVDDVGTVLHGIHGL